MKFIKILTTITSLAILGWVSFYITYEKVSAIVMEEAEERKKNEIVLRPIVINEDEDKKEPIIEEVQKEIINVKTDNFIFIGDSRLDTLRSVSNNINFNSVEFITSENADCDWIRNSGLTQLNYILNSMPGHYNIVFSPGIKDLNNVDRYIEFFNDFANQHPNQNIFILDVAPLDEIKALENNIDFINNDDIYEFNIEMKKNLNDNAHIIYAFQELIINGYNTIDGYYLEKDTSLSLLDFIWNHIVSLETKKD